jgi:hypothetical protein
MAVRGITRQLDLTAGEHEKITGRLLLFEQDVTFGQIGNTGMSEDGVNLIAIQIREQHALLNEGQYLGVVCGGKQGSVHGDCDNSLWWQSITAKLRLKSMPRVNTVAAGMLMNTISISAVSKSAGGHLISSVTTSKLWESSGARDFAVCFCGGSASEKQARELEPALGTSCCGKMSRFLDLRQGDCRDSVTWCAARTGAAKLCYKSLLTVMGEGYENKRWTHVYCAGRYGFGSGADGHCLVSGNA